MVQQKHCTAFITYLSRIYNERYSPQLIYHPYENLLLIFTKIFFVRQINWKVNIAAPRAG